MSVIRRLYNVAYGRVRLWQSGEDPLPAPELERLRPVARPEPVADPPEPLPETAREEPSAQPAQPRPRRL